MTLPHQGLLFLTCALAIAGALAGVFLSGVAGVARRMVTASGLMLLVLSLAGVLPELASTFGWPQGPLMMGAAVLAVWALDRFVYPVCPSCSHTHDHDTCSTRLHGFAGPLVIAALLHSVFDGWSIVAGDEGGVLSTGVLLHKLPESLAFGVILRAALRSRRAALAWAVVSPLTMVAGALFAAEASSVFGAQTMGLALALGGGTFLYLGSHAVHGEWKRRSASRAVRIS